MAVFDVVLPRRPGQFRVGWVSLDEYSGGRNQRHFAFGKRLGHWRSVCLGGIGVLLAESPLFPFRIRVEMKCVYLRHRYECALRMMNISFEFKIVSLSYPGHHPRGGAAVVEDRSDTADAAKMAVTVGSVTFHMPLLKHT